MERLNCKWQHVLVIIGLVAVSCKKTPPGDGPGNGPVSKDYEWVDATIVIPKGVDYAWKDHELNSIGEAVPISTTGTTKAPKMAGQVVIHTVTNAAGEPILQGFSTPDKTEISPESTAKVSLFTLYRVATLPYEEQIKFLEGFASDHAADDYIAKFTEAWKTDPKLLAHKKQIALLKAYHDAYAKSPQTPRAVAKGNVAQTTDRYYFVETDSGPLSDGYGVKLEGTNKFHLLNISPRTATAFIYKTRVKKIKNAEFQTLISTFGSGTKSDKQWFVENGKYVPYVNPYGFEVDYRKFLFGKPVFEEISSGPHELPLGTDEEVAEYTIRLVNAGINLPEEQLTADERSAYIKHMHAALITDFYLPFMGVNMGLTIGDFYALDAETRVNKLDAAVRSAGVHTLIANHVGRGEIDGLLKILETYFQSSSTDYGKKLHEAIFTALGRKIPGNLAGQAKRYGYLSYYFDGESFWNTEVEERVFLNYYWETSGLITLHATARAGVVRLSPRVANITPIAPMDTVRLKAVIETEEFKNLDLTYRWRTKGLHGSIRTTSGGGTNQLETETDNIVFKADYAAGRTTPVVELVHVEVYKDEQLVGSDSVEVYISPSNYQIFPDGVTLTGKGEHGPTIANLKITPKSNKAVPLTNNPDLDIRVEWKTAGKHGGLRWDGQYASYWTTEVETLNAVEVQYRCSDDQTSSSVEAVEAMIFGRPKNDPSKGYELIDIVRTYIKIENNEKKRIFSVPMAYLHGDEPTSDGRFNVCYHSFAATFDEVPGAERYEVEFMLSQYYIGAAKRRFWDAHSGPPNTVPPAIRPSYQNGSICISYSNGGGTRLPGQHVELPSTLNSGFAQVTVYLK